MNAIVALFAILSKTITDQQALIAALVKKGVISIDEINAEIPQFEKAKEVIVDLQKTFVELARQFVPPGS
jgi:hypothetical protein